MKISLFLILVTAISLQASSVFSQNKKMTLDMQNVTVSQVISEIENSFLVTDNLTELNRHVSVSHADQQEITVTGTVTDERGEVIPGVTVLVRGTSIGTVTNVTGNYSLSNIPVDATLEFSFVGMETQQIAVGDQRLIDVTMREDVIGIEEVVAIGYGTVRKSDLTGSIAQVRAGDIENRLSTRVDEALQGKMAGVSIQQTSAVPGAAPVIRIRGTNSITAGNQPLWVIDGMPVEDAAVIANFNVSDAESIEVLKDAASAAIYGSRGANGVILVTTKKGKSGAPTISYNMRYGIAEAEKLIDFLSGPEFAKVNAEYRAWYWEEILGNDPNVPNAQRPTIYRIDPNWLTGNVPDYNLYDHLFRTAPIQNHNISLSGGSDIATYFVSLDYLDQDGIGTGSSFERYSIRTNIVSKVTDWIDMGLNVSASTSTSIDMNLEGKDQYGNSYLRNQAPIFAFDDYYFLENGVTTRNDYAAEYGFRFTGDHHKVFSDGREQKWIRPQALINSYIDFQLIEGLTLKVAGYYSYQSSNYSYPISNVLVPTNAISNSNITNWSLEPTLNYNKQIGMHSVTGLLGYSSQKDYSETTSMTGRGFPDDLVLTLNRATELRPWGHGINEWSLISMFARGTYGYDGRYLLTASIRRDGSSRFGSDKRWGLFPSASAAWNISREAFLTDNPTLSNLRLRVSYGETGNNRIGNYAHYANMAGANAYLGSGPDIAAGSRPGAFENKELTWEQTATTNIGLDMGFLRNRINFSVDAYRALTSDLLLSVPLPLVAGAGSTIMNVGEVENRGIEMELNTRNIVTSDFRWTTTFNYSYNKNEVVRMDQEDARVLAGPWYSRVSMTQAGHPIGSFYMWQTDGIFQNEAELAAGPIFGNEGVGDIRFKDVNGDGVVDADDRTVVGQPMPKWHFGLTNDLRYKNFDFSIFINGAGGHKMFDVQGRYYNTMRLPNGNLTGNLMKRWANPWRSEAEPGNGHTPQVTSVATTNQLPEQTGWLYDASWWRIKNVTIGYTLPQSLLSRINISSLRIYVTADNLFLNTDYVGFNPEGSTGEGKQTERTAVSAWGYDYGMLPQPRTFAVGLNLTF